LDWGVLSIAAILGLLNLAVFDPGLTFFPAHDTQAAYQIFFTTYNELCQHGELPYWRPYDSYGMPAGLYAHFSISFAQSFAMVVGWALGLGDALLLFKLSLVLEQLALVLGSYLLSWKLTQCKPAAVVVALGLACTSAWGTQIWWNFRFIYALPLILWMGIVALQERRPLVAALAALAYVVHLGGTLHYYLGVHLLVAACVIAPHLRRPTFGPFRPDQGIAVVVGLGALLLGILLKTALHQSIEGQVALTEGRDPKTLTVTFDSAMTYGPGRGVDSLAEALLACPASQDYTFYFGLIPLTLALWLLIYGEVRSAGERVVLGAALLFLLISLAATTILAPVSYVALPFFSKVRYLGYLKVIVRLLGFLIVGMALRRWSEARSDPERNRQLLRTGVRLLAALIVIRVLCLLLDVALPYDSPLPLLDFHYFSLMLLGLWCVLLFRAVRQGQPRFLEVATWGLIALELLSFHFYWQFHGRTRIPPAVASRADYGKELRRVTQTHPYTYEVRRRLPPEHRASRTEPIHPVLTAWYPLLTNTLYEDHLELHGRVDWLGEGMLRLLLALDRSASDQPFPRNTVFEKAETRLALGATRDKLFLADRVEYAPNRDAVAARIREGALEDGRVLILGGGPSMEPGLGQDSATVEKFSANRVSARVRVGPGRSGAWLVYSDQGHPGWKATVDGRPVSLEEANLAFKAVWVPSGTHEVEFQFTPTRVVSATSWTFLILGCVASLSLLGGWGFACVRRAARP
jgi:hypothetical protein